MVNHCYTAWFLWDLVTQVDLQSQPSSLPDKLLINPVLAFVEVFRFKGDNPSLVRRSAIATWFDTGAVSSAIKRHYGIFLIKTFLG